MATSLITTEADSRLQFQAEAFPVTTTAALTLNASRLAMDETESARLHSELAAAIARYNRIWRACNDCRGYLRHFSNITSTEEQQRTAFDIIEYQGQMKRLKLKIKSLKDQLD